MLLMVVWHLPLAIILQFLLIPSMWMFGWVGFQVHVFNIYLMSFFTAFDWCFKFLVSYHFVDKSYFTGLILFSTTLLPWDDHCQWWNQEFGEGHQQPIKCPVISYPRVLLGGYEEDQWDISLQDRGILYRCHQQVQHLSGSNSYLAGRLDTWPRWLSYWQSTTCTYGFQIFHPWKSLVHYIIFGYCQTEWGYSEFNWSQMGWSCGTYAS